MYPPKFCAGLDIRANDSEIESFANGLWQPAHDYAAALVSTIHADLGNDVPDNLLTSPEYLQYYSMGFYSINTAMAQVLSNDTQYWPRNLPSNQTYEQLKDTTGPLKITPAVIYTQYICQVPHQKAAGTLFINVLIANLVFLQASWTLLNTLTTAWLARTDPTAMVCSGCVTLRGQEDQYELRRAEAVDSGLTQATLPARLQQEEERTLLQVDLSSKFGTATESRG